MLVGCQGPQLPRGDQGLAAALDFLADDWLSCMFVLYLLWELPGAFGPALPSLRLCPAPTWWLGDTQLGRPVATWDPAFLL